jgi:hypothetical protein
MLSEESALLQLTSESWRCGTGMPVNVFEYCHPHNANVVRGKCINRAAIPANQNMLRATKFTLDTHSFCFVGKLNQRLGILSSTAILIGPEPRESNFYHWAH